MAEDCRLISFDDFVRPQAQIVLRSSPQSLNPIMSMILKGKLKGFIIQDDIIIRNQVISYKVWEINWKSAQTRSNYSSWLSQIFFLCKGEIIRGHYRIYEIPNEMKIDSGGEYPEHDVDYQASPNTYASGRFLEFFMNGGMDLQKKFKIYFQHKSDEPETLGGLQKNIQTASHAPQNPLIQDAEMFEAFLKNKKLILNKLSKKQLIYMLDDFFLETQELGKSTRDGEYKKAIVKIVQHSNHFQQD